VDVTLHRDHHLRHPEVARRLHPGLRLADVEAAVDARLRVDVVENRIAVPDQQGLIDLKAHDVRVVATVLLVQHGGL
jgi:hypothetical protein